MAMAKLVIENVLQPGKTCTVDADRFNAMRQAFLDVLPDAPPCLAPAAIQHLLPSRLPQGLFPGGAKAGWWSKAVQLDLEAKRIIARAEGAAVRLYRLPSAAPA